MSATYDPTLPTDKDWVRFEVRDVNTSGFIFQDEEITAGYAIQQSTFQSGMFFSGNQGRYLPGLPVSYFRVAAIMLNCLASNKAYLSSIIKMLDVQLDPSRAAKALQDQAKIYREVDDDSGAMMIIEQTPTDWAFAQRWLNQFQRETAGSGFSS